MARNYLITCHFIDYTCFLIDLPLSRPSIAGEVCGHQRIEISGVPVPSTSEIAVEIGVVKTYGY